MGKRRAGQRSQNYVEKDGRVNELFEAYYKNMFKMTDEEWESFYLAMKSDLPATFRVTGFREHSKEVQWMLKNKFIESLIKDMPKKDDKPLAINLAWYPGELAWQLNASKMEIRKTPELRSLHKYLVSETNCGFISRQEAVSMIPPLLLDVQSHHKVLDLCAAPGSKTAQLIEMLHAGCEGTPSGVVIANDIDNKRCYMMVHQLQRLQSPCAVVVRQDASIFPKFMIGQSQMMFDRILVDVPCSGDGTLRKNPSIWPRWTPNLGMNEHFLQQKILRRALEMLAVGGRLVYSTCSLSPSEDEAVVASILEQTGSSCHLLDIGELLPNLNGSPGLTNWSVMLRDKRWIDTVDQVPQEHKRSIRPSLFPPTGVENMNLQYCRRIMPHTGNTGGFFLAVIEKTECLPWMNAKKLDRNTEQSDVSPVETTCVPTKPDLVVADADVDANHAAHVDNSEINKKSDDDDDQLFQGPSKKKARIFKEDPFYYVGDNDAIYEKIKEYYNISPAFPHKQLMYRNGEGRRRNFYFTNDLIKQMVLHNEDRINFVNMGVKMFGICEDRAFQGYRLLQEGIEIAEPYVCNKERRLVINNRDDLVRLFTFDYPLISEFSDSLKEQFNKLTLGPAIFHYVSDYEQTQLLPRIDLTFVGWRGGQSIRSYVGNFERFHMLRISGEEPVEQQEAARNVKSNGADADGEDDADNLENIL